MSAAFASLLEEVRERGDTIALRAKRAASCSELVEIIETDVPLVPDKEPGSIMAFRGGSDAQRVVTLLAWWRRGYSTYLLSDREPEHLTADRLREAGCAFYVGGTPGG